MLSASARICGDRSVKQHLRNNLKKLRNVIASTSRTRIAIRCFIKAFLEGTHCHVQLRSCVSMSETQRAGVTSDFAGDTESAQMFVDEAEKLGLTSARFKRAPAEYYERPLEWRQKFLGAPTKGHLCKTLCVKNTKGGDESDPLNSKYYLVVIPYEARWEAYKTLKFVRSLKDNSIGKKKYKFRFVPDEEALELTGFEHNAVTPLACRTKLPVILSHQVKDLPYFWLGGGQVDLKLCVDTTEFLAAFEPFVADVTYDIEARDEEEASG
ncbi:MAG: hypothetical protein MHM6MM_001300 [Cercozoa sp. M6MM]